MNKLFFYAFLLQVFACCSINSSAQYIIREAIWDDNPAMIALYQRSASYCKDVLIDGARGSQLIVLSNLRCAIDNGFAFVVQVIDGPDCGRIIAFLIKHRPFAKCYSHILDYGLSCVC